MTNRPELDPDETPRFVVRAVDGPDVVGEGGFATLEEAEAYAEQVGELHLGAVVGITDRHGAADTRELVDEDDEEYTHEAPGEGPPDAGYE